MGEKRGGQGDCVTRTRGANGAIARANEEERTRQETRREDRTRCARQLLERRRLIIAARRERRERRALEAVSLDGRRVDRETLDSAGFEPDNRPHAPE